MAQKTEKGNRARVAVGLEPPEDLAAYSFALGSEEFILLEFPLRSNSVSHEIKEDLTPGERAVAELLLRGQSTSEIARARGTSLRTVANQIAAVFRKVGVKSRRELFARHRSLGETL